MSLRNTFQEFQKFAKRGNAVDLVIGFTVGAAFTTLVKSLVDDLLMPPIALLTGYVDIGNRMLILRQGDPPGPYNTIAAAQTAGAVTWRWGDFLQNLIAFVIVAAAVFVLLRGLNRLLAREQPQQPPAPREKACPYCQLTIPIAATRCPHCTSLLQA